VKEGNGECRCLESSWERKRCYREESALMKNEGADDAVAEKLRGERVLEQGSSVRTGSWLNGNEKAP